MGRRSRIVITCLSTALCLGTVGMWVRSYRAYDALGRFYRKTDAEHFGHFRVEKRVVMSFRGVESVDGAIGVGGCQMEWTKRSPAIFALEWEPAPDQDQIRHVRLLPPHRQSMAFHVPGSRHRGLLGFGFVDAAGGAGALRVDAVTVPYWAIFLLTAASPAAHAHRIARCAKRRREGLCLHCGYDLRATSVGEPCPECGSVKS